MITNRRHFFSLAAASAGAAMMPAHASAQTASSVAPEKSPRVKLNNGAQMPLLGIGTFNVPTFQAADTVSFALRNGYRLVDTATNYGNEKEVGEGIARSGVPRNELFITTKLWIEDFGEEAALRGLDASLKKLGLRYIDLYLLHWPVPTDFEKTIAAYKALEAAQADGRIRALGISNFNPEHRAALMKQAKVAPAVNQIEFHPYLVQTDVQAEDARHDIIAEAWSPIGGSFTNNPKDPTKPIRVLEDAAIIGLARKYRKTPAQIVLRWHTQRGRVAIPKSVHYERILSNIDLFDFEMTGAELSMIDGLNRGERGGPDPKTFDVAAFRRIVEHRKQNPL